MGMPSCVPVPMSFVQAVFSWLTLRRLMNSNGLKRCASYVRLYISQSSGLGFSSISLVTGVNRLTCAETDNEKSALLARRTHARDRTTENLPPNHLVME